MEIRFHETFDSGEISVYLHGPLSVQTYDNVSNVMETIRKQLVSLIAPQGINPVHVPAPQGRALDPSALTDKLPGVDLTDRRRGPRPIKKEKKRR